MPKDEWERKAEQQLAADEKFRSFFTTTVVEIPKEMTQEDLPRQTPEKKGLFGRLFAKKEQDPPQEDMALEIPTGEILLGAGAENAPEEDMDLMLCTADPGSDLPQFTPAPEKKPEPQPEPRPQPKPEPAKPAPVPAKEPAPPARKPEAPAAKPHKAKKTVQKNAPKDLLPQEQIEQQEMQQLKQMLKVAPAPAKAAPAQVRPKVEPEPQHEPAPEEMPKQAPAQGIVFAAEGKSKVAPSGPEHQSAPEVPAVPQPEAETTSQPSREEMIAASIQASILQTEQTSAPQPEVPQLVVEAEDLDEPEETMTMDRLRQMGATLTLRCVLTGIFAAVLLHLGLTAEGLVPALSVLDPTVAPAAFYGANLLLLAASLFAAYPVLRDGLLGLRQRATLDTMPALAAVAALLQAVAALFHADTFHASAGLTLFSGVAVLGLFLALLGSRILLAAVQGGYELLTNGVEHQGACRAKDKDLLRTLAQGMEQKDPWLLLSHPVQGCDSFVEQSLAERSCELRARKTSYILLGAALVSGLLVLITGKGLDQALSAMAAILCMGAPLSSTIIAGLASLRLHHSAAAAGAVVPGWKAIEELGGIDTIQMDAEDLFTADSVQLEDIRIFKGGRIDRAILYAASILDQGSETLRGLFHQIVEDRSDILFPVKDLEIRQGLGFSAWCDNNRVLIGNRAYLEQEDVALPDADYENAHSHNGELQILYLAVSGNLHAMFVLKYVGGRNTARSLATLQKEGIHLLVRSQDPSLTAQHIIAAYHLPEDSVTMLDQAQCTAIRQASLPADCCLYHLKGLASLAAGLQAAEQAQNAETSATTVQMVSVFFSVAIGLLLTWAGSIWQMSAATVLMYQAAWSALSIAVCALKQHN